MDEDAKALERLFVDILQTFPPGTRRDFWMARLRNMATYTRCPQWPLGREVIIQKLREENCSAVQPPNRTMETNWTEST